MLYRPMTSTYAVPQVGPMLGHEDAPHIHAKNIEELSNQLKTLQQCDQACECHAAGAMGLKSVSFTSSTARQDSPALLSETQ